MAAVETLHITFKGLLWSNFFFNQTTTKRSQNARELVILGVIILIAHRLPGALFTRTASSGSSYFKGLISSFLFRRDNFGKIWPKKTGDRGTEIPSDEIAVNCKASQYELCYK